jgi:hypothetical protein
MSILATYYAWVMTYPWVIGGASVAGAAIMGGFAWVIIYDEHGCYYRKPEKYYWRGWFITSLLGFFAAWIWIPVLAAFLVFGLVWLFTPSHVDVEDILDWVRQRTYDAVRPRR